MSAPSKRYCKRFIEKGTSRKPATGEVASDTQLVQIILPAKGARRPDTMTNREKKTI